MTLEELMKELETWKASIPVTLLPGLKEAAQGFVKEAITPLENKLLSSLPAPEKRQLSIASGKVAVYKRMGIMEFSDKGIEETVQFFKSVYQRKALNETTDGSGGYTVPEEFNANVIRIQTIAGAVRRNTTVWPMSTDTLNTPTIAGSVSVYWPGESTAATETSGTSLFGTAQLTLKDCVGLIAMSDRLLQDTKINLIEILTVLFAEAMAKEEDTQALRGTGSPFTGINGTSGITVVTLGTVAIGSITYDNLCDAEAGVPSGAIANAKWYCSNWALRNLRKLKDDDNKPIYAGPTDKMPVTLNGFPVELTDGMPTANAAATPMLIFGDMNYLCMGDSTKPSSIQISNQATLATAGNLFEKNMSALKIVQSKAIVVPSATAGAFSVLRTKAA